MTQDQRPTNSSQPKQEQAKDSAEKNVDTAQNELDPRSELGLKSPTKDSESASERSSRQEAKGQKATQFNGNPNPQGAPSSPLKPEDDSQKPLGKESRNDQ